MSKTRARMDSLDGLSFIIAASEVICLQMAEELGVEWDSEWHLYQPPDPDMESIAAEATRRVEALAEAGFLRHTADELRAYLDDWSGSSPSP